jgi:hypothetical protein
MVLWRANRTVMATAGAQSYILGRLRHQTFFSLAECNAAIASCLDRMNDHVMRRLGVIVT